MTGQEMYDIADRIFPICRSITGQGVRDTLAILQEYDSGIEIRECPTGMQAFDWNVPKEWNIEDAYIEDSNGNKIIDFKKNNLHVLGYSSPVDEYVNLDELLTHVYTEPGQPDAIPYVTSYYKERYGFCMTENQKNELIKNSKPEDKYHMVVKSSLTNGVLNYGELVIPGETDDEILFSTYTCHPSMPIMNVLAQHWLWG